MRSRFTLLLLLFANWTEAKCIDKDIKMAETIHQKVIDGMRRGYFSPYDLQVAKLGLLEMQYCAEKIDRSEYCASKERILDIMFESVLRSTGSNKGNFAYKSTYSLDNLIAMRSVCADSL